MRTFNYSAIREQKWNSEILGLVAAIYKEAGKQELYLKQRPEELEKLVEIAKVQSTEASNAIEGIVTTNTRIRQLVEEKTTPRNRDEQEIAGYRDVLNLIHENFDAIPITQNYILQIHKILYSHMNNPMAGKTKRVQNYISATYPDGHVETLFTPLAPYETPEALDRICEEYNRVIGNMEVEPLIVIPVFIHDFLCIHPFNDGNGRMSRLLTTLLFYRSGFYVGKYISLEAKIAKNKDLYYEVLSQAQIGWHEGTEDVVPFIKYLLGTHTRNTVIKLHQYLYVIFQWKFLILRQFFEIRQHFFNRKTGHLFNQAFHMSADIRTASGGAASFRIHTPGGLIRSITDHLNKEPFLRIFRHHRQYIANLPCFNHLSCLLYHRISCICVGHAKKKILFPGKSCQLFSFICMQSQRFVTHYMDAVFEKTFRDGVMGIIGSGDTDKINAVLPCAFFLRHFLITGIHPIKIGYAPFFCRFPIFSHVS